MNNSIKRILIILGVVFLAIFLDQASKIWATNTLQGEPQIKYLSDFFMVFQRLPIP